MSKDKGITEDGFSDTWLKETKKLTIINNLWNSDIIKSLKQSFKARIVLLNKVWPNIPSKEEFRPIII